MTFITATLFLLLFAYTLREFSKVNKKLKELDSVPKEVQKAVNQLIENMDKLTAPTSSPRIMTSSLDPNDFKDQEEYMRALEEEIMSKLGDEGQAMEELEEMFKEDKKKGMLQ